MKYLFFDIECSNCFGGNGKMIEFGYCLTDENFNIIKKNYYVMSPGHGREFRFDKKIYERDPEFEFAFEDEYYFSSDEFPRFYNSIKKLIEDEDTMIFGYAITNDINYLDYTCKRYNLKPFNFNCYDIQSMIKYYFNKRNSPHLHDLANLLCDKQELVEIEPHLSRDDAIMTMLVLKHICKNLEVTVSEMISLCPKCVYNSYEFMEKVRQNRLLPKHKRFSVNKEAANLCDDLFNECEPYIDNEEYKGKLVTISALIKSSLNKTKKLIDSIKEKHLLALRSIDKSDYIIVDDEDDKQRLQEKFKKPYEGKFITLNEFLQCNN